MNKEQVLAVSFALDTGQDVPYVTHVFSRGDIASIRYAVSHSKGDKA